MSNMKTIRENTTSTATVFSRNVVLQRKCNCGQKTTADASCPKCNKKKLQLQRKTKTSSACASAPRLVSDVLQSPGQPLEQGVRSFMEPRFGHDFSQVRVHTDDKAARSARSVNARAYTVGKNIAFDTGQYVPKSTEGKRLLAHELTHVLQQKSYGSALQTKLSIGEPSSASERQADDTAEAVVFGHKQIPKSFTMTPPTIQRVCGVANIGTRTECTDRDPVFVTGQPFFKFNASCDDFATGEEANLRNTAATLSGSTPVEVHGYASIDGNATFNENLSCARALKARSVLTSAGVTAGRISLFKHGPTPGPSTDRRSVVISSTVAPTPTPTPTPTPAPPITPLTVAFTRVQASTSPTGMPNRIPPRVDTTVGVGIVGFRLPMRPVTLSVDGAGGGNGTAIINGSATTDLMSSAAVRLRGVNQTAVGNAGNLSLVARQGGAILRRSNTFSVSAIPQNFNITFNSELTGARRGIIVNNHWQSDSGNVADLNEAERSEQVQYGPGSGILTGYTGNNSGFLSAHNPPTTDTHSTVVATSLSAPSATVGVIGTAIAEQVFIFNDRRTGATNIPVRRSGYRLTRVVTQTPPILLMPSIRYFSITKAGTTTTANGYRSAAGSGSVSRIQRV